MITKIAFIGHPVKDIARARKFYGDVLGLANSMDYEDMWSEFDTPDGKSIGLDTLSPDPSGPYLALESDDIEAEMARLKEQGVKILLDVKDNKVCKMAFIEDSEGNKLMLHEMAADRKK